MISVRPVNRLLGFEGIWKMTLSDVVNIVVDVDVHLPEINAISFKVWQVSNCSAHGVSCTECAAAHGNVMSI